MRNFKKAYNLKIVGIVISGVLMFTGVVWAEEVLRVPVGTESTHKRINLVNGVQTSGYTIGGVDGSDEELIKSVLKQDEQYGDSPVFMKYMVRLIGKGSQKIIIVTDSTNQLPAGFIIYKPYYEEFTSNGITVTDLFINHEYRRRGLGRLLIEYCQRQFNYISLLNEAPIEFREKMSDQYLRLGFQKLGGNRFIWERSTDSTEEMVNGTCPRTDM